MTWLKENWFNMIAAFLLFWALSQHPYSYFQILRWFVCASSAYNAYLLFEKQNKEWGWVFVVIAIIFNPITPFYLAKNTWQILDLVAGIIFVLYSFKTFKLRVE